MGFIFDSSFDEVFDVSIENADVDGVTYEDNIFGGHDIFDDGVNVGHSEDNIFQGEDYYDADHRLVAHTQDNGIGGEYVYSDDGFEGTLVKSLVGDDIFYGADGTITHLDFNDVGNGSAIMQFDDPLAHINSYIMPDLIL